MVEDVGKLPVDLPHRAPDDFARLEAQDFEPSPLGVGEGSIAIDREDNHGDVRDEGAQLLLAFLERNLRPPAFRDVLAHADPLDRATLTVPDHLSVTDPHANGPVPQDDAVFLEERRIAFESA